MFGHLLNSITAVMASLGTWMLWWIKPTADQQMVAMTFFGAMPAVGDASECTHSQPQQRTWPVVVENPFSVTYRIIKFQNFYHVIHVSRHYTFRKRIAFWAKEETNTLSEIADVRSTRAAHTYRVLLYLSNLLKCYGCVVKIQLFSSFSWERS